MLVLNDEGVEGPRTYPYRGQVLIAENDMTTRFLHR